MLQLFLRNELSNVRRVFRYRKYNRIYRKYKDFTVTEGVTYYTNLALTERFRKVPGVVVECGVWRGGMIAGMAEILGAERQYYLFDNFEGMPPPKTADGLKAQQWVNLQKLPESPGYHDNFITDESYAHAAMKRTGAPNYQVVKGWFEQTLAEFKPAIPIAVLRLDAGWYEATLTCLKLLYPYLNVGGVIILDDYYGWEGSARALHTFLVQADLADRIAQFDNTLCYVVKMAGGAKRVK